MLWYNYHLCLFLFMIFLCSSIASLINRCKKTMSEFSTLMVMCNFLLIRFERKKLYFRLEYRHRWNHASFCRGSHIMLILFPFFSLSLLTLTERKIHIFCAGIFHENSWKLKKSRWDISVWLVQWTILRNIIKECQMQKHLPLLSFKILNYSGLQPLIKCLRAVKPTLTDHQ